MPGTASPHCQARVRLEASRYTTISLIQRCQLKIKKPRALASARLQQPSVLRGEPTAYSSCASPATCALTGMPRLSWMKRPPRWLDSMVKSSGSMASTSGTRRGPPRGGPRPARARQTSGARGLPAALPRCPTLLDGANTWPSQLGASGSRWRRSLRGAGARPQLLSEPVEDIAAHDGLVHLGPHGVLIGPSVVGS